MSAHAPEKPRPVQHAKVGAETVSRSRGFEWLTPSPPPKHNFAVPPRLDYSPYDYTLSEEEARDRAFTR